MKNTTDAANYQKDLWNTEDKKEGTVTTETDSLADRI